MTWKGRTYRMSETTGSANESMLSSEEPTALLTYARRTSIQGRGGSPSRPKYFRRGVLCACRLPNHLWDGSESRPYLLPNLLLGHLLFAKGVVVQSQDHRVDHRIDAFLELAFLRQRVSPGDERRLALVHHAVGHQLFGGTSLA